MWRIGETGSIHILYATDWDDPGPFGRQVNSENALINPAMILMYVPDRRSEDVRVAMPDVPLEWQAAGPSLVSLEQISRARQFVFSASSYDAIADAPVEAGKFEEFQITGINPPITVVVHGENWK